MSSPTDKRKDADKRVLVVDDDDIMLLSCQSVLERSGYLLELRSTGREGLDVIESFQPAVLVVDLKMPEVDGFQVIREARHIDPKLSLVAITGFGTEETADQVKNVGGHDFLPKPFTPAELRAIVARGFDRWKRLEGPSYHKPESELMRALTQAQREAGGWIPREELVRIAASLGLSVARVYGVRTFYSMYNRKPIGRYHLEVDTNIPATLAGARTILEHLETKLGIAVGETTSDRRFTLSEVEDLASCGTCPVIAVNGRYYENMTVEKVDALLASLREGKMPDWKPEASWGSRCNILLRRRGVPGSAAIDGYRADGGYRALEKALGMQPGEIVGEVKAAVLRGRGGAGFPAGDKWSFLPRDPKTPVYLVCNADEGEPGTFKDRQIMEFDPHLLIEGMVISGYAIGARTGYIYIRGEFGWIADILEKAIVEARSAGILGKKVLGHDVEFDVIVHRGAGAYICGEETALIESLEGKRGNPRLKPPFPASRGLYGSPTSVNNVETLACVPYIIEKGAAAFRQIGVPNSYGPKIFGVSGHVNRPGVYEYPLGTPLTTVLEAAGGVRGKLKAVIVGGLSVPVLTAAEAEGLTMDYDSCTRHGTMLGSGGIIVMNESTSIPAIALRAIEFYAHESCGQCAPCRRGVQVIASLLRGIVEGRGQPKDIDQVLGLCASIKGTTLCPAGDAYTVPISAMVRKFRSEFEMMTKEIRPS